MNDCLRCGFWDAEREGCMCPATDMWYACPIEASKKENQDELKEYVQWLTDKEVDNGQ